MKRVSAKILWFFSVLILAWQSRLLFWGWWSFPYEEGAFFAFLIWLFPLPWASRLRVSPLWFFLALIFAFLGMISTFNTLTYLGFAFICIALCPLRFVFVLHGLFSIAWMPAWGWIALHLFPEYVYFSRIALAILSSILVWVCRNLRKS